MTPVTINGQTRYAEDLAHYADYDEREAVHATMDADSEQEYWSAFAARYPESMTHLIDITPVVRA